MDVTWSMFIHNGQFAECEVLENCQGLCGPRTRILTRTCKLVLEDPRGQRLSSSTIFTVYVNYTVFFSGNSFYTPALFRIWHMAYSKNISVKQKSSRTWIGYYDTILRLSAFKCKKLITMSICCNYPENTFIPSTFYRAMHLHAKRLRYDDSLCVCVSVGPSHSLSCVKTTVQCH